MVALKAIHTLHVELKQAKRGEEITCGWLDDKGDNGNKGAPKRYIPEKRHHG